MPMGCLGTTTVYAEAVVASPARATAIAVRTERRRFIA
jgi:hypothetical protein